jgi:hypothetical protein
MSRPPQNLNLIDYAMAEAERVFIGVRFLLREKLKERRRSNAFCFLSRPMNQWESEFRAYPVGHREFGYV